MSIPSTKSVVVIGATGAQGNGVVRGLSGKDGFAVKAVTRNPSSDKAKTLAELPGVTLISADMDEPASLDAAFAGAYGVFMVTNFWEATLRFEPKTASLAMLGRSTLQPLSHDPWAS